MEEKNITIVINDDWTQVYVNDKLVRENHLMYNSDWQAILKELKINVEIVEI